MNNENVCYIPTGVKAKPDIIPGMGKRELLRMAFSVIIELVILFLVYLLTKTIVTAILVFLLLAGLSYFLNLKDKLSSLTLTDELQNFIRFKKMQKLYLYEFLPEDAFYFK